MSAARRRSDRIPFQAPAQVRGALGFFDGRIEDISRSGLRLRMRRDDLRLRHEAGIGIAAECVERLLGETFSAALDTGTGGAGVLKRLSLVRLALPDDADDAIDLGCLFEDSLTSREMVVLGLDLPGPRAGDAVGGPKPRDAGWNGGGASRVSAAEAALIDEVVDPDRAASAFSARASLRAVITSPADQGLAPLVCSAESFTPNTVLVRARGEKLALGRLRSRRNAAAAAVEITKRYGERIDLELVEAHRRVWQGPTHVCSVEVDARHARDLLLRLAFGRPLQRTEIRRLSA